MKTKRFHIVNSVLIFALLFAGGASTAFAIPDRPLESPENLLTSSMAESWQGLAGSLLMPGADPIYAQAPGPAAPLSTGGPDSYGYTWNDSETLAWKDASGGADRTSSAVDLGFDFKFYENTYSQIFVSQYGYATFEPNLDATKQTETPNPASPNNVIAPYWAYSNNPKGYIRTLSGGNAPQRFFVAEWNHVGRDPGEDFTYELVLFENGDIVFQYLDMTITIWGNYGSSGIEDSQGLDGLVVTKYFEEMASNHAVRISRPAPRARVNLWATKNSSFTRPDGETTFQLTVRNLGELGSDTYELASASAWPISLYAADGVTALSDTDGDGMVDTGPVSQGGATTLLACMHTSGSAVVGDAQTGTLTATSSLNPSASKTVSLQAAVPAPFAQVFLDTSDGAMSLSLVRPAGQATLKAAGPGTNGGSPAIAEMSNGNFVYAWTKSRCLNISCQPTVMEIEYMLVDRYGETLRSIARLTDHSAAIFPIFDQEFALAATLDGHIGVIWLQVARNATQDNYNLFLAILDNSGNISAGPINISNNTSWDPWESGNSPHYFYPRITATADSRFTLAWYRSFYVAGCTSGDCSLRDIYFSVRDSNGDLRKDPVQLTHDTSGNPSAGNNNPSISALSGNRTFLAWEHNSLYYYTNYYAVLTSNGDVIVNEYDIYNGGGPAGANPHAVQLSNGNILVAWDAQMGGISYILYKVLGADYWSSAIYKVLDNPPGINWSKNVSLTTDQAGNAILTWLCSTGYNPKNLCYALLDGSGAVKTQPMIFQSSQDATKLIQASATGGGNASYSSIPAGVDISVKGTASRGGAPGNSVPVVIEFTSRGQAIATGVVLKATLGPGLTYVSDSSGVSHAINSQEVTWNLPSIGFLEKRQFVLGLGVPAGAALGTRYEVTLDLSSSQPDIYPLDNSASLEVMASSLAYIGVVRR